MTTYSPEVEELLRILRESQPGMARWLQQREDEAARLRYVQAVKRLYELVPEGAGKLESEIFHGRTDPR